MGDKVIQVENLWKEYRLGVINHNTLSRDIQSWWARVRGKDDPNSLIDSGKAQHDAEQRFWALRDLTFEVKQGDLLGIIGRNGAGKSTLLKILSQVTAPTKGEVRFKGRIASLLEVGTGFHPELTGRENIFLNGAILGMSRLEIRKKFDEIVAFAEIEKFLNTPVKRYSSGMYVRLAFAVAAHLEPEILVVDEVLAVGDVQFQRKCLGKMEDVGKDGRTVLFVSHNMAAVENICRVGIILDSGAIAFHGKIADAVSCYLNIIADSHGSEGVGRREDRCGEGLVRIIGIDINGKEGLACQIGAELHLQIDYEGLTDFKNPRVIIGVYDLMGVGVTRFDTEITCDFPAVLPASGRILCTTASVPLTPGRYYVNVAFFSGGTMQDHLVQAAFFDIIGNDFFNTGKTFNEKDSKLTKVLIRHTWNLLS